MLMFLTAQKSRVYDALFPTDTPVLIHAVRRVDGFCELDNVRLSEALHVQALELVLHHLPPYLGLQADAEVALEVVGLQPVWLQLRESGNLSQAFP